MSDGIECDRDHSDSEQSGQHDDCCPTKPERSLEAADPRRIELDEGDLRRLAQFGREALGGFRIAHPEVDDERVG